MRRRYSASPRTEFRGALRVCWIQVRDHSDAEFTHISHTALRWLVGWQCDIGFGVSARSKRRALIAPCCSRCWRPQHGSTSYPGKLCWNTGLTSLPPMVGRCVLSQADVPGIRRTFLRRHYEATRSSVGCSLESVHSSLSSQFLIPLDSHYSYIIN